MNPAPADLPPSHVHPASPGRLVHLRASLAYALLTGIVLFLVRLVGEAWWPVLVLLYMPRGVLLGPAAVLLAGALRARNRRAVGINTATLLVVAGPLMGFNIPWSRGAAPQPLATSTPPLRVRIATFNRGLHGIDAPGLIQLIEREAIDVICLQEGGGDPLLRAFWSQGWHRTDWLASRWPIERVETPLAPLPGTPGTTRCEVVRIRPPGGAPAFQVVSVHLETARPGFRRLLRGDVAGLRRHLAFRSQEAHRLAGAIAAARAEGPTLLAGDLNLPHDSRLLRPILAAGFRPAFASIGWGYGYTCPQPWPWARVDQILADPRWTIRRCVVGPALGSDHRLVWAEVVLVPASAG